jgi:hypothetical protein
VGGGPGGGRGDCGKAAAVLSLLVKRNGTAAPPPDASLLARKARKPVTGLAQTRLSVSALKNKKGPNPISSPARIRLPRYIVTPQSGGEDFFPPPEEGGGDRAGGPVEHFGDAPPSPSDSLYTLLPLGVNTASEGRDNKNKN